MHDVTAGPRASLGEALDRAAVQLERAGVANGKREATSLWAAAAGVTRGEAWLRRDAPAPDPVTVRFWDAVARRASGMPFAYAVGRIAFRTLELTLDPRALIPRPETEGLIDLVLHRSGEMGTGGGGLAEPFLRPS